MRGPAFLARGRARLDGDAGSATVELAACLPAMVLLLLAGMTAVMAVVGQVRCVDAAREAARAQARGSDGVLAGRRAAPEAAVSVTQSGESVRARVVLVVRPFGLRLPGVTVSADAVAAREPGEIR
ncbi:TadE family type IV pilus minor pilin [Longispora sp. NPDC051575]|uniref:TadE family type IV pilus minor pilin n=1 Tax=Longispora sp. NPDC051575 TaxID=3154943 RepID=UPI0034339E50